MDHLVDDQDVSEELFQLLKLGQEVVACNGWRWTRGLEAIATINGPSWKGRGKILVDRFDTDSGKVYVLEKRDFEKARGVWFIAEEPIPLLNTPGTKGWMLHLIREHCGVEDAYARRLGDSTLWAIMISDAAVGGILGVGRTEHEALAAALINMSTESGVDA